MNAKMYGGFGLLVLAVLAIVGFVNYWHSLTARKWDESKQDAARLVRGVKDQYEGVGAYNSVTTEPGLRQQRSKDITLENFMNAIDRVNPSECPMNALATNESDLGAIDGTWNVDSIGGAKGAVGRADNEDAPTSASAGSQDAAASIRKVGNIAQAFSRTFRHGWLAGVPRIAGVDSIQDLEKTQAMLLLKQDVEVAMCSLDQVAFYDAGVGLGAVGAGYLKLTDFNNKYANAGAYAIGKPSDLHYAPTGACLTGALTAVHSRAMWKRAGLALRQAAKTKGDYMLICGLGLRGAITDLTDPHTVQALAGATGAFATASITADQVRVRTQAENDSEIGASVDVIRTDFGRFLVSDSDYIGTTTTDSGGGALTAVNVAASSRALATYQSASNAGLIVKKGNVMKRWVKGWDTEELGRTGGGQAFDTKGSVLWGLRNPIRAGWLNLT